MTIENKMTGKVTENVTIQQWENLVSLGHGDAFRVIDKTETMRKATKIDIPKQIVEFQSNLRIPVKPIQTKSKPKYKP